MSLRRSSSTPSFCGGGGTVAECCGGTTASCAALWCCAPCSIVTLLVLAVYKLPRGLCRRAILRVRRRQLLKKMRKVGSSQFAVHPLEGKEEEEEDEFVKSVIEMDLREKEEEDEDVVELEKEMWNRFYSGGFWRSLSQAETASSSKD